MTWVSVTMLAVVAVKSLILSYFAFLDEDNGPMVANFVEGVLALVCAISLVQKYLL